MGCAPAAGLFGGRLLARGAGVREMLRALRPGNKLAPGRLAFRRNQSPLLHDVARHRTVCRFVAARGPTLRTLSALPVQATLPRPSGSTVVWHRRAGNEAPDSNRAGRLARKCFTLLRTRSQKLDVALATAMVKGPAFPFLMVAAPLASIFASCMAGSSTFSPLQPLEVLTLYFHSIFQ
jgi:hypothetical protein